MNFLMNHDLIYFALHLSHLLYEVLINRDRPQMTSQKIFSFIIDKQSNSVKMNSFGPAILFVITGLIWHITMILIAKCSLITEFIITEFQCTFFTLVLRFKNEHLLLSSSYLTNSLPKTTFDKTQNEFEIIDT